MTNPQPSEPTSQVEPSSPVAAEEGLVLTNFTADGVNFLDRSSGITCPTCPGDLQIAMIDEFKIAACVECHSLLIQKRLFAAIIRSRRANYKGDDVPAQPLNSAELHRKVACAACGGKMETYPYCGPGSVVIDSCMCCGLVWLDKRELKRIIEAPGSRELAANDLKAFDEDRLDIPKYNEISVTIPDLLDELFG